jgi:two-component system, NarL family, nitrate/nitrite response regulator NarL
MVRLNYSGSAKRTRTQPVRTIVVDDHTFMRELIGARLSRENSRFKILAEVGDAAAAVAACRRFSPDLVILDINLPDQSGIDAVAELKRVSPETSILLCTAYATDDRIADAMKSGAEGFVEKTNTWDDFINAVNSVSGGERYFRSSSPKLRPVNDDSGPRTSPAPKPQLSQREREVLALIAEGSTSKEIATKLFIGLQTVETHRANLMSKLRVRNMAGMVVYAVQMGLVKLPGDCAS